jgi:hypothetical protein
MPDIVTHRYDPALGACRNVCSLPEFEALQMIDRLRRQCRPTLKPNYFYRRLSTEQWLLDAVSKALGRRFEQRPAYFFLGDFSYGRDPSRPAALVLPLSTLPTGAISFTLGDSMTVAEQAERRLYKLDEIVALFGADDAIARFGFSDQSGFQADFIEVQVWDRSWLLARES